MFSFLRKKTTNKVEINKEVKKENIEIDINELLNQLSNLDGKERVALLDTIGEFYLRNQQFDIAMKYYEESISLDKKLGKSYSNLMKIYNIKRKEASENGDTNLQDEYLVKIDELLKLSKDSIRGLV